MRSFASRNRFTSARKSISTILRSSATSSPTAASARASSPRKRCATCVSRWDSPMISGEAALDLEHPSPLPRPLARVYGEPVTAFPEDLYIPPEALEVFLETFEGPLDLLLYLIRRQNINVLDIPMAELTRQYLGYVEMMRRTQLELAADDLRFASAALVDRARVNRHHLVTREQLSVRSEMSRLLKLLQPGRYREFTTLFAEHADLPHLVVTFLALLELSREQLIDVAQAEPYAPIHVQLRGERPFSLAFDA